MPYVWKELLHAPAGVPGHEPPRRAAERRNLLFDSLEDLSLYDGMHVVVKPGALVPTDMQSIVVRVFILNQCEVRLPGM